MKKKKLSQAYSKTAQCIKIAALVGSSVFALSEGIISEANATPFLCQRGDGIIVVRSQCKTELTNSKTKEKVI